MGGRLLKAIAVLSFWGVAISAECQVGHLIKTRWGQKESFNKQCPINRDGNVTPPGCGAVAVGQILFHYGKPADGFGSVSYDYVVTYSNGVSDTCHVSWDFESHPFDMDNILLTYDKGNYTEAQADAVSDYLSQIGKAMFMQYRESGSSPKNDGSQLWGLHHHLKVSPKAMYHYRENYTTEEWRAMLDNELEQGRPVYYGAGWYHYNKKGELDRSGHFFIIDGKNEDGTYCVNWGNSYKGDAVDLEIMNQNPAYPFIGGNSACYHTRQCMITGLVPAKEEEDEYLEQGLMCTRPLILNDDKMIESAVLGKERKFTLRYRVQHYSGTKYENIHDGLGLYRKGENEPFEIIHKDSWKSSLNPGWYSDKYRVVNLGENLSEGEYDAWPMSENAVTGRWQKMLEGARCKMEISVKNNGEVIVRVPHNYTGPTTLYLCEPIKEVKNPYGSSSPGRVFQMKIANMGINNYEDSLRVSVKTALTPKPIVLPYYLSVYEGQEMNLQYLVPETVADLGSADVELEVEYFDSYEKCYKPLLVRNPDAVKNVKADIDNEREDVEIYNLDGQLVYKGMKGCEGNLNRGIYIERQGATSRKIFCR